MTVTVLTWGGAIGHSALRINDKKFTARSSYPHTFISWFPADGAAGWQGFSLSTLFSGAMYENYKELRGNQAGSALNYVETMVSEMSDRTAQRLERGDFPATPQQQVFASRESYYGGDGASNFDVHHVGNWVSKPTEINIDGLDEDAIMGWWYSFVRGESTDNKERGGYRMISKTRNCASMVMRALIAGGAATRISSPTAFFAYDPPAVKKYAETLSRSTSQVRISVDAIAKPGYAEWMAISNSSLPFASRMLLGIKSDALSRNAEMLALDSLIMDWVSTNGVNPEANLLISIFTQIGNYLRTKPHGDRTMSVVILAKRIYLYTTNNHNIWDNVTKDIYELTQDD